MPPAKIDKPKILEDIKKIKEFINEVERFGGRVPELRRAVGILEQVLETAKDIGTAVRETSKVLKNYTDDLYKVCNDLPDPDAKHQCEYDILARYQARNIEWTLSWDKNESVIRKSLRNVCNRIANEGICERLDSYF